jgi:hypothetical protein
MSGHVENREYASFAIRVVGALGRRAAQDPDALPELRNVGDQVEYRMKAAIRELRSEGYSWADVGHRLGMTRQAAQQRYGRDRRPGVNV